METDCRFIRVIAISQTTYVIHCGTYTRGDELSEGNEFAQKYVLRFGLGKLKSRYFYPGTPIHGFRNMQSPQIAKLEIKES